MPEPGTSQRPRTIGPVLGLIRGPVLLVAARRAPFAYVGHDERLVGLVLISETGAMEMND